MEREDLEGILGPLPPEERAVAELKKKAKARERELLAESVGQATARAVSPLVERVEQIAEAIRQVKIEPPVIPPIELPKIEIPKVEVPPIRVEVPKIEVPKPQVTVDYKPPDITVKAPDVHVEAPSVTVPPLPDEVEVRGLKKFFADLLGAAKRVFDVRLTGIDRKKPLHVVLVAPGTDSEPEPYEYKAEFKGAFGGPQAGSGAGHATEVTLAAFKAAFDDAVTNYISYLDDIAVYESQISTNTDSINSGLTSNLYEAIANRGASTSNKNMMVGGVANGAGQVSAGQTQQLMVTTHGVVQTLFSSLKGDEYVEPKKEAVDRVDTKYLVPVAAFRNPTTNAGIIPATDTSQRVIVAIGATSVTQPVSGTVAVSSITTAVTPGTAAANLGKAKSSAAGATDTGVAAYGVRNDTPATLTEADSDYTPIRFDSIGRQWVRSAIDHFGVSSDTFTATGNGAAVDCSARPKKNLTLQVSQTGVVTSWDLRLEVSLDNSKWGQVAAHTNATPGDQGVVFSSNTPFLYYRVRCAGIVLGGGTNVVAKVIATD